MKTSLLAILFLLIGMNVSAQSEISQKQIDFANKFIQAVGDHDQKKVIKMLDKEYRKEQLAFLNGNKKQLVDELFGGEDMKDPSVYANIKLENVLKIEIAEVIPLKGNNKYNYIFRVRDGQFDILTTLILKKKGKKFGFVGAFG